MTAKLGLPLLGLLAGAASGLLGVGGGIIIVPLLVGWFGFSQHGAHATSLVAIIPIATAGAATFASAGDIEAPIAVALAAGSLAGAPIGAQIMAMLSETVLRLTFGLFLTAIAVRLLLG